MRSIIFTTVLLFVAQLSFAKPDVTHILFAKIKVDKKVMIHNVPVTIKKGDLFPILSERGDGSYEISYNRNQIKYSLRIANTKIEVPWTNIAAVVSFSTRADTNYRASVKRIASEYQTNLQGIKKSITKAKRQKLIAEQKEAKSAEMMLLSDVPTSKFERAVLEAKASNGGDTQALEKIHRHEKISNLEDRMGDLEMQEQQRQWMDQVHQTQRWMYQSQ